MNEMNYEIVTEMSGPIHTYKYLNRNDPNEEYTVIYSVEGTRWKYSLVTFKPENIPDAPEMIVDTSGRYFTNKEERRLIYLPRSIDKWEIEFYSCKKKYNLYPCKAYLKNAGVVNLNEEFKNSTSMELELYLRVGQSIIGKGPRNSAYFWDIPDVDWWADFKEWCNEVLV